VVKVVGGCGCGCATVHLAVPEGSAPPSPNYPPIPVEATVHDEHDNLIGGIIVFVDDGYLSNLEIYSYLDGPIRTFPPVEEVDFAAKS
jgi:hypothetical protein